MSNKTLFIVILLPCILGGINLYRYQAYQLIESESNLKQQNLIEFSQQNIDELELSPQLEKVNEFIGSWKEILVDQEVLTTGEIIEKQNQPSLTRLSSCQENKPVLEETQEGENTLTEYGYSFWMRFLTAHPDRLLNGKNAPWYFISRLTSNENYHNIDMGDRLLAIWQGQGYYHFTTCNQPENQPNVIQNINYPDDIEGLWTFVYYSYSATDKKAVAFIKYGEQDAKSIVHVVGHPVTKKVKFILGGTDNQQYPGFNGLFSEVSISVKNGVFLGSADKFIDLMKICLFPKEDLRQIITHELVKDVIERIPNDEPNYTEIKQELFAHEYSISGWFKWEQMPEQKVWHNVFRVQINRPGTDKFLGDRTLSCWIGTAEGGILHFPTYTYTDMNGAGLPNLVNNIQHKNRINNWFFAYFGYSKDQQKAFVGVRFISGIETLEYNNVNHYYTPKFYIFIGKDMLFPGLNGGLGYVNFNLGDGAFKKVPDFKHTNDIFGLQKGVVNLFKKQTEVQEQVSENQTKQAKLEVDQSEFIIKSTDDQPKADKTHSPSTDNLAEYGYGMWAKFYTAYPERLLQGKNQQWYFLSRLTLNIEYENARMGDRGLAIWLGQGYYHFTTCNTHNNQVNVIQNIDYPEDIEGLWTYIYYSYNAMEESARGMIKFGTSPIQSINHNVLHPATKQVRLIVGGTDNKRYPGFNGILAKIYFSYQQGAFINSIEQLQEFIDQNSQQPPIKLIELTTTPIIKTTVIRDPPDSPLLVEVTEKRLVNQYAISGWFQWKSTEFQKIWHNIFRVQIKTPSTDAFLGDRTLTCWIGTVEGGILHFPTYSYTNMNGGGNNNFYKNIQHKQRQTKWFFIYFGYSKELRKAAVFVKWTDSSDTLIFENINHYYSPTFYVYAGKDQFFQGFSGKMSSMYFNIGDGSYRENNQFDHPQDAFGYNYGLKYYHKEGSSEVKQSEITDQVSTQVKTNGEEKIVESETDKIFTNGLTSTQPAYEKDIEDQNDLQSYGYGFWLRFLTQYPEKLLEGKKAPFYFLSRLTWNRKYDNLNLGDRALAIWQGEDFYHFTTCNFDTQVPNIIENIKAPEDIEGLWTYIYYSYSVTEGQAVGFIKYGSEEPKQITTKTIHMKTKFVKFILGGNDNNRYPGFNGQFKNIKLQTTYIGSLSDFNNILLQFPVPLIELIKFNRNKLIEQAITRQSDDEISKFSKIGGTDLMFPSEYGIGGWYLWKNTAQQPWHNVFRVQLKEPSTDIYLGDRTLSMWISTIEGGILHFPTYTYTNMRGEGNNNYYKNIQHKNRLNSWFFVYFGYSKKLHRATVFIKWHDSEDLLIYEKTMHYYSPEFFIYVGKDKHFTGFNGQIAQVNFNIGDGSYIEDKNFNKPEDPYSFNCIGDQNQQQSQEQNISTQEKQIRFETNEEELESSFESDESLLEKDFTQEAVFEKYGYGLWLRFLHLYPKRLLSGKNAPWYFVSRLTSNRQYDNINMGDRLLAIWLGQGFYHFATCDSEKNQPNVVKNIDYPHDIEGLWIYIHYSYNKEDKKAMGFIRYSNEDIQSVEHLVTHQDTKYLKLIVGGSDKKRYPCFNGLFSKISITSGEQNFISTKEQFQLFINKLTKPKTGLLEQVTYQIIGEEITRKQDDEPMYKAIGKAKERFPLEYSISGWFKWTETQANVWHNLFRAQIKQPSTDTYLGDRMLGLWIGQIEGGILHFPTYTYTDMNGQGNANYYQNIKHIQRHLDWFYVYFGYSKSLSKAYALVNWADSEEELIYEGINHYFTPEFYLYAGRDKFFPGHNGQIAYLYFDLGNGSFKIKNEILDTTESFLRGRIVIKRVTKSSTIKQTIPIIQNNHNSEQKETIVTTSHQSTSTQEESDTPELHSEPKPVSEQPCQHDDSDQITPLDKPKQQEQQLNQPTQSKTEQQTEQNTKNSEAQAITDIKQQTISQTDEKSTSQTNSAESQTNQATSQTSQATSQTNSETEQQITKLTIEKSQQQQVNNEQQQQTTEQNVQQKTQSQLTSQSDEKQVTTTQQTQQQQQITQQQETTQQQINTEQSDIKQQQVTEKQQKTESQQETQQQQTTQEQQTISQQTIQEQQTTQQQSTTQQQQVTQEQSTTQQQQTITEQQTTQQQIKEQQSSEKASEQSSITEQNTDQVKQDVIKQPIQQPMPSQEPAIPITDNKIEDQFCSPFPSENESIVHEVKTETEYQLVDHNSENPEDIPSSIEMPMPVDELCKDDEEEELVPQQNVKIIPGQTLDDELFNSEQLGKPIADQGITVTTNLQEYGYGYWMRFLTYYPKQLLHGKIDPWYFISRLTRNKNYDNIKMGDRTLAIWQGAGYYHFTTYDLESARPNVLVNVEYPNDIEGIWTYVYYSYSLEQQQAVAHIRFGLQEFKTIKLNAKHAPSVYLRFILGGTDQERYPTFNGVFRKISFGIKAGTFIATSEQLLMKADSHIIPNSLPEEVSTFRIIENENSRNQDTNYEYKVVKNKKIKLPSEYSISGWFKQTPAILAEWQNLFRIQIRKESTDTFLGDRTLSCWMGKTQGGIYQFPTYTYTNMIGNGNPNLYKNIQISDRNTKWHYIYFGYTKITSQAYGYIKWFEGEDELLYENINHYYVPKLYVYIGKDRFYPGFTGKLTYVVVNFGLGSFRNKKQFNDINDIFNYDSGAKQLFKKSEDKPFQPLIKQDKMSPSSANSEKPAFESEENGERVFKEYGYGFWMRFLTNFPERLQKGIEDKMYFVSRLTWNKIYDDRNMGDRALAIWLGKGFYQFTTCNVLTKNEDQSQNLKYPLDIEGLWTFVYYSYSKEESKAVGFLRFASEKNIQQITHQTSHQDTKYLKLIVGGNDKFRYSGFNGQFSKISISTQEGTFIDQSTKLRSYTFENKVMALITKNIISEQITKKIEDKSIIVQTDKVQLPSEYAISGWFKWVAVEKQQALHNIFKVSIETPSTNQVVGDNTLSAFVAQNLLQFSTYSFENMQCDSKEVTRTVEHKNRHLRWFFIYFGYNKEISTGHVHLQWQDEMSSQGFSNINHYYSNQYVIYVGGDDHFPGFSGMISQVNFNMGVGAYRQTTDYKDENNIFGFDFQTVKKEIKHFDITQSITKTIIDSSFEKESDNIKVFNKDQLDEVVEYGYGFWIRFLRNYPTVLINGLKFDWSFISRLSSNDQLQDITVGDRALAIWLGKGFYHFTTYNDNNANIFNNVNHPADIEGLWTFIHYSHNLNKAQSVSYIIFGSDKPIQTTQSCSHTVPQLLKYYLGGSHLQYKGFNGQIANSYISVNKGIYIESTEKLEELLKSIQVPASYRTELKSNYLIERLQRFEAKSEGKQIQFDDQQFSSEYSWSGWFKWSGSYQNLWHLVLRLSTLENGENMSNLGDRTLGLWVGQQAGGILYFSTYTYNDIYGSGNPNSVQNVQYKDDLTKWHFIYFGYSKTKQLAYGKVEFGHRNEEVNFKDHHHYLPNMFILSVGKDKWHDAYQGSMALVKFTSGNGAFHQEDFKDVKDDIFAHKLGSMELLMPKQKFDISKEAVTKIFASPQVNQQEPLFSKIYKEEELENVSQYGYGFWCRFLTHYPTLLVKGLQVDWSFISRLTKNSNKGDLNVGDRTLAIWLGKGYYHFATYSHKYANIVQNVDHPIDIEGLWTFIYFSHNLYKKESIGMIKFGTGKVTKVTIPAIHENPVFLQLFIGGNNMKYPAYNGQFAGIIFSISEGVFKSDEVEIETMLDTLKKPNDFSIKLQTKDMIAKAKQQFVAQETVFDDIQLVGEYAWSGWFKWKQVGQQFPWYLMVRLAILKNASDITLLGDRTLMAFMGQGYIHFTTYSVKNINGEGTVNIWQNINHEGEHIQWHYVYFGYSKEKRLAYGKAIFDDRPVDVSFKDTNHYLPSLFALTIGKDKWFNQYNGDIAYFRFNAGQGAFTIENYEKAQNDMFAYKIGRLSTINPNKPPPEEVRVQEQFDSSVEGQTIYEFEISKEIHEQVKANSIQVITSSEQEEKNEEQKLVEQELLKQQVTQHQDTKSEEEKFKDEQGVGLGEQHYQFPGKQRIVSDESVDVVSETTKQITKTTTDSQSTTTEKIVEEKKESDWDGLRFYGYGFYLRYLTMYPQPMKDGKSAPFYFISRLTWNPQPQDIGMGDRVLAVFQGQGVYSFHTLDKPSNNPNIRSMVPYGDIEGVWTFVYFSYSQTDKKAVVFVKYDDNVEVMKRDMGCFHGDVDYLKLFIGGKQGIYPGFNGQIANYAFRYGKKTAYINDFDLFRRVLQNRVPHPVLEDYKLQQNKILETAGIFKGDETTDDIKEITQSHFQTEYAISGWLRWDQLIGQPFFAVFRLSAVKLDDNTDAKLGDRDMMLFKHTTYYLFQSYNYQNLNGAGDFTINWQVNHEEQEQFWHFFYIGYKRETQQLYYYISFIDDEFEQAHNNIKHFVVNKHYLQFGRDFNKFANKYRGFTGQATYVSLSYGKGSFQKKPIKQDIDIYMYLTGAKELFSSLELITRESDRNKLLIGDASKPAPLMDIEITEQIRGLNEYGWALWCRWSRTLNHPIASRDAWYSIARLVNRKNHQDLAQPGDRTLASWVGMGFYLFSTYTKGVLQVVDSIPYGQFDGQWNFLVFTYSKNIAKASVLFGKDQTVVEKEFKVKHNLIKDYLRFVVGAEFQYKFFNGHMTNIQLRLGKGAHLSKEEILVIANGELQLPGEAKYDQSRKTLEIIKERTSSGGQIREYEVKEEIAQGKEEYSISGWAKWVDMPQIDPWYVLYRVTLYDFSELLNPSIPGARVFSCHKAYGFYHFNTYTANQENGGVWQIVKNIDYDTTLHKNWVYFYQAYSHSKQQVHVYVKYPGQEEHFTFTQINHYIAQKFKVHFLLDRWAPGFNGFIESWYFNAGYGSYKESDYGIGENEETRFGFGMHKVAQPKNFYFDDVYPCGFTQQIVGQDVEYKDELQIDGLTEFGYGMWTRFAWNTPIKMIDKPAWMALSRLTVNPNYSGDAAQLGDRSLAIWVGSGFFHFTTSTRGNYNVVNNLQYDQELDGQWNYIWFGYKRIDQKQGTAAGYVAFDGSHIRRTKFDNILQQPLNDYLYLAVGSSGKQFLARYNQFNGHIAKVSLVLGSGGYIDKEDDLRKFLPSKPDYLRNLKLFQKVVIDEMKTMKRSEWVPSPVEFNDEFDGAVEYSVSLWFKWTKIGRVAWENIFSLSYNEPQFRANHARPGDRVLSMFQYADHRIFFSTYTTPNTNDQFAHLYTECPVDVPSQSEWVYGYYGYSRNKQQVASFLQTKSSKCLKKLPCMHRVPKYMGLYIGKDGIHTPYNGKFSKMYILGHQGAYIESQFESFEPFAVGGLATTTAPYFWSEQKAPFEIAYDQNKVFELKPEDVDEQTSYGIGMWTKYYTAIPKRLLDKPDWLHIARLTINQNHNNYQNIGDRTLSLFLGRGYYGFFTYNALNNNPNIVQSVNYQDNLEGEWNFIYFSYSLGQQMATGFVKFGGSQKIQRIQFRDIQHKPVDGYAKIVIGNEFTYKGFNGIIANLQVGFGTRYYVHDVDALNKIIPELFKEPVDGEAQNFKLNLVDQIKERAFNSPPDYKEITDQKGVEEYAMYGWFRYTSTTLKTPNNSIMRLTNNEQAYRKEISSVGDRTLLVMLQPGEYVFATYSLGHVDSGAIINIRKPTPYKSNLGLWTYIYFGYSFPLRKASGIIKYPSGFALVPYENVLHMVPNYLLFFFGGDGMLGGWHGQMQKVNLLFGKGSFVDSTKGNFQEKLQNLQGVESVPLVWDGIDNKIIEVPLNDKPAIDVVFNKDVTGFAEYGYGLWTRWLTTIPKRIVEKAPFHQLIRLCSTENYEDAIALGNRVLAVWVGKGYYHFTTYNKIGNKISISDNIDYGDNLEGQWNYIYYSFTNKGQPRAVAFVYFSEMQGTAISRIEFQNLEHIPLNGYARVVAASKEFGYQSFNGMVADLQIHLGNGFIGSKEQLTKEIIQLNPKPPLDVKQKQDINIIKDETLIKPDEKKQMQTKYEEYKGVLEYSVSGWVQSKVMGYTEAYKNVFRLTINPPELQRDKQYAGDRTLALFLSKTKYAFSTYTYGKLDTNEDDSNEFNRNINVGDSIGEWVFVYFGYQFKSRQAFAYTLFLHRQDSALFSNIKHFVPNQFWFYLTNDGFYPIFDGSIFDWNLSFGDGSFTTKPRLTINQWPIEPQDEPEAVFSALLANKGLNSLKIVRPPKAAEQEFKNNFPKSGVITSNPVPLSGQISQRQFNDKLPSQQKETQQQKVNPQSGVVEPQK